MQDLGIKVLMIKQDKLMYFSLQYLCVAYL